MLNKNMPAFDDAEGIKVPAGFSPVIDAHVHIFPDHIFSAIRKWFDQYAWPVRYRMATAGIFDFLLTRGVDHIIALQYAHKPGIARQLNDYMCQQCAASGTRVTGLATVFPGEENTTEILQEAFDAGLGGLKLHAHVQCFDMNSKYMDPVYECCRTNRKPLVMHVGREPKSPAYGCDPYEICSAEKLENVLKTFPDLKICVPHMGFDEIKIYRRLVEKYDNLWLDTTMVLADYFRIEEQIDLERYRPDRVMYGSDFPNIPYAWDRELKALSSTAVPGAVRKKIAGKNAAEFFSINF